MFGCAMGIYNQGFAYLKLILSIFHDVCSPFPFLLNGILGGKIDSKSKQLEVAFRVTLLKTTLLNTIKITFQIKTPMIKSICFKIIFI